MHVMASAIDNSTKGPGPNPGDVTACTCLGLRKAARAVTVAYDNVLKPAGLKATQFSVLATLDHLGPLPMTRLAEYLLLDRTALSRNLKPLIRDGRVRLAGEADQRVRLVTLTPNGKRTYERALPLWKSMQAEIATTMGHEDWANLLGGLGTTVEIVQGR